MGASNTIILGTRKGAIFLERGAKGWRTRKVAHSGIPVSYVAADPRTGHVYACLDHGHWGQKLSRSKDAGETWEELPAPKYPEDAKVKSGKPAALSFLWMFTPGGKDQPGRVYFGTEPGGLFELEDGFRLNEGLWNHPTRKDWMGGNRSGLAMEAEPAIHSIVVDVRDSKRVFVGISAAGIFASSDGGRSWEPRNKGMRNDYMPDPEPEVGHDPHFFCQSAKDPEVFWQQNHCGIFRSTDSAKTWTKVSQPEAPAHFGFPIACDGGDTAWVVPAIGDGDRRAVDGALCVSLTQDGGKTWTALREGLPQENAFDVVYRHALDRSGERLAFGTTTGNVYVSNDRGESWITLGNNFPPVYSVRFGPA